MTSLEFKIVLSKQVRKCQDVLLTKGKRVCKGGGPSFQF